MRSIRGLRTRLCPECREIMPHRTLYAKTESGGKTRWFPLFWACAKCDTLNHVVLPRYRLESAFSNLPSTLTIAVVNALQQAPLDFDELVASLRRRRIQGVRHVFDSEVALALEYLKGRGVVAEEAWDRTERTLDALRARPSGSRHLGVCPAEQRQVAPRRTLVSLYAQRRMPVTRAPHQRRFTTVGVRCLHCGYYRVEFDSLIKSPAVVENARP